jgi:hypothetical protein
VRQPNTGTVLLAKQVDADHFDTVDNCKSFAPILWITLCKKRGENFKCMILLFISPLRKKRAGLKNVTKSLFSFVFLLINKGFYDHNC